MIRDQAADAQKLYDGRAKIYDASFHKRFAAHVVQLVDPRFGKHVLDLACGTGLVTSEAAKLVASSGLVVGVDISTGMLAEAHAKFNNSTHENIQLYQHSITELDSLPQLQGHTFDAIICASALVLLPYPGAALQQWTRYLKPGGRLITDATHPRALLPGITLERVGRALNVPVPSYREAFQTPEDLAKIMRAAGLVNTEMRRMSQHVSRDGSDDLQAFLVQAAEPSIGRTYTLGEAAAVFDRQVQTPFGACFASEPIREQAKELFESEWAKLADESGILSEVDEVFVGVGWKPESQL